MTFFSIFKCNVIVDVVLSVSLYKLIARTSKSNEKLTFEERASPFITQNFNNILVNSFHAAKIWIGFEFFWISILP